MSNLIKSAEEWVNIKDEVFKEMEKKYGSYRREYGSEAFEDISYVADLHIKAKEYSLKLGDLGSLLEFPTEAKVQARKGAHLKNKANGE